MQQSSSLGQENLSITTDCSDLFIDEQQTVSTVNAFSGCNATFAMKRPL